MKLFKRFLINTAATLMLTTPLIAASLPSNGRHEVQAATAPKALVHELLGHYTTHNGSHHVYVGTTLFGDQIEIEDGSFWMTNPNDRYKLQEWNPGDSIMVMQNNRKSTFPYILYNEISQDQVEVQNSAAPIWDGFYTHYIIAIHKPLFGEGTLKLNDGTVWILPDSQQARDAWTLWEVNDTVIIGTNNSFFYYFNPNILINITCSDQFVTAKCIN